MMNSVMVMMMMIDVMIMMMADACNDIIDF